MKKKNILFICNDSFGRKMAGPAIRCIELASLLALDFIVVLAGKRHDDQYHLPLPFVKTASIDFSEKIISSDIIIFQGDALARFPDILKSKALLIADMYCPIPLEYHISSHNQPKRARLENSWALAEMMQMQLYVSDYFLCASKRQLDFWAGALAVSGRFNALSMPGLNESKLDRFFGCVPFGIKDENPIKNGNPLRAKFGIPLEDFVLVWGGGFMSGLTLRQLSRQYHHLKKKESLFIWFSWV